MSRRTAAADEEVGCSDRPQRHERDQLVDHVRGGDGRDLRMVVRGGDLDHVGSDHGGRPQAAEQGEQLAAGEPARLGRAGARERAPDRARRCRPRRRRVRPPPGPGSAPPRPPGRARRRRRSSPGRSPCPCRRSGRLTSRAARAARRGCCGRVGADPPPRRGGRVSRGCSAPRSRCPRYRGGRRSGPAPAARDGCAVARSRGSAMVWSPPTATRRPPLESSASAPACIWLDGRLVVERGAGQSPASTTWASSKGMASRAGWYGLSSREPWRTAAGPKRAPGR